MTTHQLADGTLSLTFQETDNGVQVSLRDEAGAVTWGPTVPFVLEAYSWLLQASEPVAKPVTRVESGPGWVEVSAYIDTAYVAVGASVRFSLEGGELVARVPTARVQEPRAEVSRLSGIHLLPGLMSVETAHPGHLVLPQRQGVLCYPERHSATTDRFLIYGEQRRWELLPLLPCCGVVRRAQGNSEAAALLAIVEAGDCDAECRVDLDGQGGGETGFSLRYLYTPIDPVDPIDRLVRFVPLRAGDANYAGMGRRMNRFVMGRAGCGTLEERAAQCPGLAYSSSAFVLKVLHACKGIGPLDGSGDLNVYTTCRETMEQLALLKDSGIDRVWVQLTGWNPEGHDGMWPTRFPIEPEIGGDAGFQEMIAYGQSLGFQMQVHDNYLDNYARSPEFDEDQCIGGLYGGPLKRGCWGGGLMYAGWGLAFPDERLYPPMRKLRDEMGIEGTLYIDDMGLPLEISYNPAHGEARYRRACAEGVNRTLRVAREVFGSCGTENGFLYCVPDCDYIGSTWQSGFPPQAPSPLADETVPLWLMAVKGHLFSNLHDTFHAAIDLPGQEEKTVARRMLMMAEFGLAPRNETVAVRNPKWCYPIEETIEAMKFEYDLMIRTIPGTIRAALVEHEVLWGTADGEDRVVRSRFSDGTETVCDYGRNLLFINGAEYPLPVDYQKKEPLPIGSRSPLRNSNFMRLSETPKDVADDLNRQTILLEPGASMPDCGRGSSASTALVQI